MWMCHALVGSVGAVVNGLELLKEEPTALAETVALIDSSAMATTRRLKFFRVAFGQNSDSTQDGHAVRVLLDDFLAISRSSAGAVTVRWLAMPAEKLMGPGAYRLVLGICLLAMDCLPRGGILDVSITPARTVTKDAALAVSVTATGRGARLESAVSQVLMSPQRSPESNRFLSSRTAPAAFVARLALRQGATVLTEVRTGSVIFSAAPIILAVPDSLF